MSILLVALASSTLQATLPQAAPNGDEVVVTGHVDAIERFVEGLTVAAEYDQLSRWQEEVCPRVIGASASQAGFVTSRLERLAVRFGVPYAKAGCRPNLLIAFTPDADAVARTLATRRTNLFKDFKWGATNRSRARRWREPATVRWIHLTRPESAANKRVRADGKSRRLSPQSSASIRGISAAVLLVDSDRLSGVTWGQLTDYLALAAFTRADPDHASVAEGSIFSLFSKPGADQPNELTARDKAFLAALYDTSSISRSAKQRRQVRDAMARKLEGDPAEGAAGSSSDQRE